MVGRRDEVDDGLIDAPTAAGRFCVSVRTFWRMVSSGLVPQPVRVGRLARWFRSEIDETLTRLRERRKLEEERR